jgi:hypothetical protein
MMAASSSREEGGPRNQRNRRHMGRSEEES